jgi:acetyl/propionyl-CoA carboxylase alpha subunit
MLDGGRFEVERQTLDPRLASGGRPAAPLRTCPAPMPGAVVIACMGRRRRGAPRASDLIVIESMKLETALKAPRDGVIAAIAFGDKLRSRRGACHV